MERSEVPQRLTSPASRTEKESCAGRRTRFHRLREVPVGPRSNVTAMPRKRAATKAAKLALDAYVPYLVNRAATAMLNYSALDFKKHGLTVPQWRILVVVWQAGVCRFGRLAELTSIEPPTLSRLLNAMQRSRLISKRRVRTDSRSVDVSLTLLGVRKVEETMPFALTVNERFLAGIDDADVDTTRRVLVHIHRNAAEMESRRP